MIINQPKSFERTGHSGVSNLSAESKALSGAAQAILEFEGYQDDQEPETKVSQIEDEPFDIAEEILPASSKSEPNDGVLS